MNDSLDKFFHQLENMIDAQDDMWIEEQNSNIKWRDKIKQDRYEPAKKAAREAFEQAVVEVVKQMFKNRKDISNVN